MGNTIDTFRVRAHENQAEFDQLLAACQSESSPKTGQHGPFRTANSLARARRLEPIAQQTIGQFGETNQPHLHKLRNKEANAAKPWLLKLRATPTQPRTPYNPTP